GIDHLSNDHLSQNKAKKPLVNSYVADTSPVAIVKFCLQSERQIAILDSTASIVDIFGFTAAQIIEDSSSAWMSIDSDDRGIILQKMAESAQTMQPL
ncbi:MAG TPA: hypothetical protein DEG65_11115, partial [Methylophaga sp.]|nr:hypothetical protein [Methylophaga sp.]